MDNYAATQPHMKPLRFAQHMHLSLPFCMLPDSSPSAPTPPFPHLTAPLEANYPDNWGHIWVDNKAAILRTPMYYLSLVSSEHTSVHILALLDAILQHRTPSHTSPSAQSG